MKLFIIVLCLLSFPIILHSNNFKNGYIITMENDTLMGLIDFRPDKKNAEVCRFRLTKKSDIQEFYPGEIKAYRFIEEGKFYVSKKAFVENTEKLLFLEYLVQGTMSLYHYGNEKEYYFLDKEGMLVPVTQREEIIEGGRKKIDNKFKGTLAYLFQESPEVSGKAARTKFRRSSMVELTKDYHAAICSPGEECIVFENDYKRRFARCRVSVYGGWKTDRLWYSMHGHENFNYSTGPVAGARLNIYDLRFSNSIGFMADVSYSEIETGSPTNFYNKPFSFKASQLDICLGAGYSFVPEKRLRPVLELALATRTRFNIDNNTKNYYIGNKLKYGYHLGAGCDYNFYKRHALFFRVVFQDVGEGFILGMINQSRDGDRTRTGKFIFGYTF